ncbi:hypothetical protein CISIN_1g029127mg [Citrus sinensis]|uniref:Uncharacterized protein n=1 Tax=Citrus sinensis TaxID=2711 RepID=A0A067F2T1_CITSI|nr:hypothetical protein CISIN_1g029127mg [Citrus sinensis]
MEETRKREREQNFNQNDDVSSAALKMPRATLEDGGDGGGDLGDDIMAWLSMDDDTMSQLMNLLDTSSPNADSATARTTRVKFIDNPYKSLVIFQSSSSYVTINGNEESCGSSFSDSESSVMVSVDTAGIVKSFPTRGSQRDCEVSAWSSNEEEKEVGGFGFFEGGGGEIMDGCDGSDLDDYVLPKFLVQEQEEAQAPF